MSEMLWIAPDGTERLVTITHIGEPSGRLIAELALEWLAEKDEGAP